MREEEYIFWKTILTELEIWDVKSNEIEEHCRIFYHYNVYQPIILLLEKNLLSSENEYNLTITYELLKTFILCRKKDDAINLLLKVLKQVDKLDFQKTNTNMVIIKHLKKYLRLLSQNKMPSVRQYLSFLYLT